MPKIFISYRREETAGYAGRLRDRLVQHFGAEQVFMDVDTIELGVDFGEVIEQAVTDVDVFLCVMGPEWATLTDDQGRVRLDNPNDFVRMEVASAIGRDIRVIPVLVRNAVVPTAEQLPPELEALTRRNALQLTDTRFHADVDRLVEGLRKLDESGADESSTSANETSLDVDIPAADPPKALEPSAQATGSVQRFSWKGPIALLLIVLLIGGAGYGWHQYSQEQQRVAHAKAEAAKREAMREAALREERAAAEEEAKREAERAAELAARREAERAERERLERERAEAELQARREAQDLERQQAELRAEEEARLRAREQAELEARREAELAAEREARRREAQAEAERVEAAEAERRREAQIAAERAEARRQAELEARAQAQREAEAAERRRNEALKVRAKRMVDDIARLYGSHKTADNCGIVRRIATTLERYFDTHYPLPDDARVSVRYPRRIDEPKVSDLARDRNLRIRRAKSECF